MADSFDPYYKWLGIRPEEQPADHYRLLGLSRFEEDAEVIEGAADQRMAHLKTHQTGQYASLSQQLLNEVAAAKVCLLNQEKRARYDEELRQKLGLLTNGSPVAPPPLPAVSGPPTGSAADAFPELASLLTPEKTARPDAAPPVLPQPPRPRGAAPRPASNTILNLLARWTSRRRPRARRPTPPLPPPPPVADHPKKPAPPPPPAAIPVEGDVARRFSTKQLALCSGIAAVVCICTLILIFKRLHPSGTGSGGGEKGDSRVVVEPPPPAPNPFLPDGPSKSDVGEADDEQPKELDVDPTLEKPAQVTEDVDEIPIVRKRRGAGSGSGIGLFDPGSAPRLFAAPRSGAEPFTSKNWGSGGEGDGFGTRGSGHRQAMLASGGGTKQTKRAVTAALIWLANHQSSDGSWSLQRYTDRCSDRTCTCPGSSVSDVAATAFGLLPFLADGQTHKTKGPYRQNINGGLVWLVKHQNKEGDLGYGVEKSMYSHGLATMALCEAYSMSGDKTVGLAAQAAVNFIINAQTPELGSWRYTPKVDGDTSVFGWQIMALKSARMAGLNVGGSAFDSGSKWLDSVAVGTAGSRYCYQPGVGGVDRYEGGRMHFWSGAGNTMTAVGLLCRQYLGAKRDSPMMVEGVKYLMSPPNLPDSSVSNIYYWYYATQVLHNMAGYEWEQWNRKMRKVLVDSQCKASGTCANGSWDPSGDQWAKHGGRIMMTSLCCLTLEIYYRYPPLFQGETEFGRGPAPPPAKDAPKKTK